MNPNIFRQYSIRGIADQYLKDEVVTQIGRATGTSFRKRGDQRLVVGRDVRRSSLRISHMLISHMLISSLVKTGIHVIDVGMVRTPVHNFATDAYNADGRMIVTASHNPPEYNGLKIRSNRSLRGEELREIYRIAIEKPVEDSQSPSPKQVRQIDPLPLYLENIKTHARISSPLKVVVDGGNGTNGLIVSRLLSNLDCKVIRLYCEPDGDFRNRAPDPTAPGALTDLSAVVRSERADLCMAYNGDGDRLAAVDEQGQQVFGDQVLMLLARDKLQHTPAKIVYEMLCTKAVADDVIADGGEPVVTLSGYAFVHQAMHDTGADLGEEFSGHLFFNDPGFGFDDPILATIKLLNLISRRQRPLSALVAELPAYCSSPQIRIPCPDSVKARVVEEVKNHFKTSYPVDELDGAGIDFGDGWALVRASNTQPALSLRFEATSEERLEQLKTQVPDQVEHLTTRLGKSH